MGNKQATFTQEQLDAYQDCTFFTRKEILRVFKRYRELNPDIVPKDMTTSAAQFTRVSQPDIGRMSEFKMPLRFCMNMPEIKENPFRKRICEVFSEDGSGDLTFEDFLDMFSVFSESAPRDIKSTYAFKIYDFDRDNYIGKEDLQKTVQSLTKSELTDEEVEFICDRVLEEADLDDDGMLSYMEFEHVISRAPDFLSTFHIRI